MREVAFIEQNKQKWIEFEKFTKNKKSSSLNSDQFSSLYIHIMNDLSFAQTNYPNSKIVNYLNQLASQIFVDIYKMKRADKNQLIHFFKIDVPLLAYRYRKFFYGTFILFAIFLCMGVISAKYDNQFARLVLSDEYINTTIENIKKGDPIAVYKSGSNWGSFIGITMNNLFVGLKAYLNGIFLGLGSVYSLFSNSIMLGTFQYFFYEKGVLLDSVRGIWIHGSMEIFGMVIEASCGIIIGCSILFPNSYSRLDSFKKGFRNSLKIFISTMPFTVFAGFLEGYITRYSNTMPLTLCFTIIFVTLTFISSYYLIYPIFINRKLNQFIKTQSNV